MDGPSAIDFPAVIWTFWFGPPLGPRRLASLRLLRQRAQVPIVLVNDSSFRSYEVSTMKIHEAFQGLSGIHKSDYAQAYFAHHYGGGVHDVKGTTRSWAPYFELLARDPRAWMLGSKVEAKGHVACNEYCAASDSDCLRLRKKRGENATHFESLEKEPPSARINGRADGPVVLFDRTRGACCMRVRQSFETLPKVQMWIGRPRTRLTFEWMRLIHERLDAKLPAIAAHPPPHSRCCLPRDPGGYPMRWAELKGDVLHPLALRFRHKLLLTSLPGVDVSGGYVDSATESRALRLAPLHTARMTARNGHRSLGWAVGGNVVHK